jgi:hypothetical protein
LLVPGLFLTLGLQTISASFDGQSATAAYSVNAPSYFPKLDYWPGALVLGASGDSNNMLGAATALIEHSNGYALERD